MDTAAVQALYQRRGSVVLWEHATPADPSLVDPLTGNPQLSIGGPRVALGPFGETYGTPYHIRAYYSKKVSKAFWASYGIVDQGDAQLDIAVPFVVEPFYGITALDSTSLAIFNAGQFVTYNKTSLIAKDRFTIFGIRWLVKNYPVPIQDLNTTLAWRILIGKETV